MLQSVFYFPINFSFVGKRYEGEWKDGKFHGRGIYLDGLGDVYNGSFANGLYHGKGALKKSTGDVITGEFSKGKPSGQLKIDFDNGDVYEGNRCDCVNGYCWLQVCLLLWPGQMAMGHFEGKGKYSYAESMGYYEGSWKRGKKHGKGVRVFSDDSKYVGEYVEDEMEGEGMMFYANGDQYLGKVIRAN